MIILSIWIAMLLGLVQGVTEFLPVSSSGHLTILQVIFGAFGAELPDPSELLFFDVLLHFGTLIAVFIAFRQDILEIIKSFFALFSREKRSDPKGKTGRKFLLFIIIATVPIVAVAPFSGFLENLKENLAFVGAALLLTSLLLFVTDKIKPGKKDEGSTKFPDAVVVGIMQAVAVIPGLSRSGSTIFAGVIRGFNRQYAVRFAFIMSIPAVLGATILHIFEAIREGFDFHITYIPGMLVSAVFGYLSIILLKRMVQKGKFGIFAIYCAVMGVATIVLNFVL